MASADGEVEQQLKKVGKQLLHPSDSVGQLLGVLDRVEKLLLKVDQSPKKSMLEALKPLMNALIQDSLLQHSCSDVKVAVAFCISEITRITAPDAPYTDDQMRDVFQLTVSSFEDIADQSSQSYNKRASILDIVSKVRSCVIMLDLECDELILKMFKLFLRSVRDHHLDSSTSIFSSMEDIMVLVIEESEEISVELLKPLLDTVKKDREGVLPVAHKLGKGVLLKSAEKLKPYMMPALTSLGESLDMYDKVVAAVCEGTTTTLGNNDDNDLGLQLANGCKMENGSVDEAHQADESKVATTSSDHVDKVAKDEACAEEDVDPTVDNRFAKPVMCNGVTVTVNEDHSVDQESKKPEEDKTQEPLNKEDSDESYADMLTTEKSIKEMTSKENEKKDDNVINSAEPSDASHVEGDKEIKEDNDVKESENESERDNDVKQPENQDLDVEETENEAAAIPSETEKDKDNVQSEIDNDVKEPENQAHDVKEIENEAETIPSDTEKDKDTVQSEKDNDVKELENQAHDVKEAENEAAAIPSETVKDKDTVQSENDNDVKEPENQAHDVKDTENEAAAMPSEAENDKDTVQSEIDNDVKVLENSDHNVKETQNETATAHVSSAYQSNNVPDVSSKQKQDPLEDETVSPSESGAHVKKVDQPQSKGLTQEDTPEAEPQTGKGAVTSEEVKVKLPDTVKKSEDGIASSNLDAKLLKNPSKSTKQKVLDTVNKSEDGKATDNSDETGLKKFFELKEQVNKSKQSGKRLDVAESDTKKAKHSGKKVDVKEKASDSDSKPLKLSAIKTTSKKKVDVQGEESGSDAKPLKTPVKKVDKSNIAVDSKEESDDGKPLLKMALKKINSNKKDGGKIRGNDKNVAKKDEAKSLSGDDVKKITSKKKDDGKKRGNDKIVAEKDDEMDISPKSTTNSGKKIKYDESLIGAKVKVWWPADEMYYKGVVDEYYPARKKHKISYEDGDAEILHLKTQKWKMLRVDEELTDARSEEASPEIHKKKKSKTDPAASQEKIKDSAKRVGGVSSSGKSKGTTPKDNKSTKKSSGKSSDEETPKTSSKTKTVNKSKGQTPLSGSKPNTNPPTKSKSALSKAKEPEVVKSTGNTIDGSKSGKKRKKTT